jgi:hypothetical protein
MSVPARTGPAPPAETYARSQQKARAVSSPGQRRAFVPRIDPNDVFTPETMAAMMGARSRRSILRAIRARELRASRRLGRYQILGC